MLFAYPIVNSVSYALDAYFRRAAHDLDEAAGSDITIIYIGDPEQCGEIHRGLRSKALVRSDERDASKYVEDIHKAGREQHHRLGEMKKLEKRFGLPAKAVPCIVFIGQVGKQPLGILQIRPSWFGRKGSLQVFDGCLQSWLKRDDVRKIAASDSLGPPESRSLASLLQELVADVQKHRGGLAAIHRRNSGKGENDETATNVFQWDGEHWRIRFRGAALPVVDDLAGLRLIHYLVDLRDRGFSAVELARAVLDKPELKQIADARKSMTQEQWEEGEGLHKSDGMESLIEKGTPESRGQLIGQLENLRERREDRQKLGGDTSDLDTDIAAILDRLAGDYDASGRPRYEAASKRRAQVRINQLLKRACERLGRHNEMLALHFRDAIHRERAVYCYRADSQIHWDT